IVCVKAIDHMPPACKYTNNKIAVKATEKVNEIPVDTWMAEAKAIAVATDHIGKANAVIAPAIPFAARPYVSPINPDTVTSIFLRNDRIIKKAMIKICTISAMPYQKADIPFK